jgi:hypothetical protein
MRGRKAAAVLRPSPRCTQSPLSRRTVLRVQLQTASHIPLPFWAFRVLAILICSRRPIPHPHPAFEISRSDGRMPCQFFHQLPELRLWPDRYDHRIVLAVILGHVFSLAAGWSQTSCIFPGSRQNLSALSPVPPRQPGPRGHVLPELPARWRSAHPQWCGSSCRRSGKSWSRTTARACPRSEASVWA